MFLGDMVWYLIHVGHGSPMSHSLWFYPSYSALPWLQKGPIQHFIKWWHFQRHNLVCLICSSKRIRDLARKKLYGDKCVGCQFSCSSTQIMMTGIDMTWILLGGIDPQNWRYWATRTCVHQLSMLGWAGYHKIWRNGRTASKSRNWKYISEEIRERIHPIRELGS